MQGIEFESRYELENLIGSGGFAKVYKVYDKKLKQTRALKVCTDQESRKTFLEEGLKLSTLKHAHLPRVYDIFDSDEEASFVMDYLEGQTLERFLEENGALSIQKSCEYMLKLCSVVSYLHQQRPEPLLHRDIKPQNIIIHHEGSIYLFDLGASRTYSSLKVRDTEIITTIPFSPPEVMQGVQTDIRSDIYSIGLIFFMMLTGGNNPVQLRNEEERKKCPTEALRIIDKCTALVPFERYESVRSLEDEIRALMGRRMASNPRRLPIGWHYLITCVLMLASGVGGYFLSGYVENYKFQNHLGLDHPSEMNPYVKQLIGKTIDLKAFNEQYVQMSQGSNHFFADTNETGALTHLVFEEAGRGMVAIKAPNSRYLTAPKTGRGSVVADAEKPTEVCHFQMAYLGKKEKRVYFSLKSTNGYFLSSDIVNNGSLDFRSKTFGGGWETFFVDEALLK